MDFTKVDSAKTKLIKQQQWFPVSRDPLFLIIIMKNIHSNYRLNNLSINNETLHPNTIKYHILVTYLLLDWPLNRYAQYCDT